MDDFDIIYGCCAGLDVHPRTVVASARRLDPDGQVHRQTRTFGTTTAELLEMDDWLAAQGVTHVAMESTGVYWKPVYHILEGHFTLLLVNAAHLKKVEGRKTDVKDAEWIAQLLQHGLLKPSFVPPETVRDLRDLTRQRAVLVRDRAAVANRIQKVLEDANIKLAGVASDVLGVSGRAMIEAMIRGDDDPAALAELARRRLRAKLPELRRALRGRVRDHHRFLLRALMDQIRSLEDQVARYTARIEEVIAPLARAAGRLTTIPGVGARAAEVIVAEIGADMSRFPTAGHLSSWAGLCPGKRQTGPNPGSGRTTKGSQWLRTMLVQVAWAASRTEGTVFQAQYRRWSRRMGRKKAIVAVAHKVLTVIYAVLNNQGDYQERYKPNQAA
jgi:transposase